MPLMQLSTLVLPAPFGPIRANNSPAFTAKYTSSRTVSPPNRSVRRSISSSAIPSPAAAVLFDLAIASPALAGLAEIELLHVLMAAQPLGAAVEHDTAVLHHVAIVGDRERRRRALLHDQNGEAEFAADFHQPPHKILDGHWRQTERQLVDQQQLRHADERAAERQHL